jgi:hypothetical protein
MPTNRLAGLAAVLLKGVCAGTIESSSGKANVTPTPRKNVRRGTCFLVMNIYLVSFFCAAQFVLSSTFVLI